MIEQMERTPQEDEPNVMFRAISDRHVIFISRDDDNARIAEISGYDLHIDFNFTYIKSMEDVETVVSGISELCRNTIMKQLLSGNNEQKEQ